MDRVNNFSQDMLLHYAAPNHSLIVEVMQFDASYLGELETEKLSMYILVLGQYLVMLQYNDNLKNIEHMLAAKTFEHSMTKTMFTADIPKEASKTVKERRGWLLLNDEKLKELDDSLAAVTAEKMLISGMCKSVEGLLNALKKEKSGRFAD